MSLGFTIRILGYANFFIKLLYSVTIVRQYINSGSWRKNRGLKILIPDRRTLEDLTLEFI